EGKISIIWNHEVEEVLGDNTGVTSVRLKSTQDESKQGVEVHGLFVAIGHKPNTGMFDGQLNLRDGYIQVQSGTSGNATATSVAGVFAAGDVADSISRQA
ncbi:FAD-dependent oxidoreductase, partial [Acinetobacter baumannii]|uniref:FAD-dependent oxidoreductase n=1 Tax=Acinetobacter baumannii TaxID=470 RepID=UPI00148F03D9